MARLPTGGGVLTHSEAELQHMHGSFLLQEVHEAKEEVLLLPDLLQLQLQHLHDPKKTVSARPPRKHSRRTKHAELTEAFLLLTSAYFCKNGTGADGGSAAGSGCRATREHKDMRSPCGPALGHFSVDGMKHDVTR